jgi:hypothetical protein
MHQTLFYRLFLNIAGRLISYIYEDLHRSIGLLYTVNVAAGRYVSEATVWMRKTTYFDIRYRLLMVLFNVSVW